MDLQNNWYEEKQSAYLYKLVAKKEKNPQYSEMFLALSLMAEKQAQIWESQINKTHPQLTLHFEPSIKTRILVFLIKICSLRFLRPLLAASKIRGMAIYRPDQLNKFLEEAWHRQGL